MKIGALAIIKKSHNAKLITNILDGVLNDFDLKLNILGCLIEKKISQTHF
jgi:hypothetical protein